MNFALEEDIGIPQGDGQNENYNKDDSKADFEEKKFFEKQYISHFSITVTNSSERQLKRGKVFSDHDFRGFSSPKGS